ncbi:MAG: type II secretion system protein, partial [Candidatus Aquilonibacter sp.]
MRRGEAGFTLLELVVTVAIAVILIAAGGVWMMSMRPGALRAALNDFDANLAAAKAISATSGNGATLIFEPQSNGSPGFTLSVYSGRPTASGAVTSTNTMIANSAAAISEAHFGNPPFAIFLSSAGYPTGTAHYPSLSGGVPSFTTIATEPPCPSGGIELTFTSPQGVTATRSLECNVTVASAGGTDPTPSPNPMKVEPTYLLAHYTTDSGPLTFKAVEYGYYHWYDSLVGQKCQMGSSDTGAPPAVFPSPWPYAQPSPSSQGALAPAPPNAPYTWPVGDLNDPPALFQLSPVLHNGGLCTVTVADDYNQSGTVTVQVMGDLTPSTMTIPALNVGQSYTIDFSKTFDSERLVLYAGGPCQGVITATPASGTFPGSPAHNPPATGSVIVTAQSQGTCNLVVQDQYGERITFGITVQQQTATWPQQLVLGALGNAVGLTSGAAPVALNKTTRIEAALGPVINALLGGGVARAYSSAGQLCNALGVTNSFAWGDNPSNYIDRSLPSWVSAALNVYVDSNGCLVDSNDNPLTTVGMIAYNPAGTAVAFKT